MFISPEADKAGVVLGLENTISAEDNARFLDRAGSSAVRDPCPEGPDLGAATFQVPG
jgi:hypothetical protein